MKFSFVNRFSFVGRKFRLKLNFHLIILFLYAVRLGPAFLRSWEVRTVNFELFAGASVRTRL